MPANYLIAVGRELFQTPYEKLVGLDKKADDAISLILHSILHAGHDLSSILLPAKDY